MRIGRLVLSLALGGCAYGGVATAVSPYCSPPTNAEAPWQPDIAPPNATRFEQTAALLGLSDEIRVVRTEHDDHDSQVLVARVRVLNRLALARTMVDATLAELACESERAQQVATFLEAKQQVRNTGFVVSSVVVTSISAVVVAFLFNPNSKSEEVAAATGGAIGASLALVPVIRHPTIEFLHNPNALAEIWTRPARPRTFPDFVWAFLTQPQLSNGGGSSLRARVVAHWKEEYQKQAGSGFNERLLFGAGGRYDAATLRLRANMLHQVEADVSLVNQDLAGLAASQ